MSLYTKIGLGIDSMFSIFYYINDLHFEEVKHNDKLNMPIGIKSRANILNQYDVYLTYYVNNINHMITLNLSMSRSKTMTEMLPTV